MAKKEGSYGFVYLWRDKAYNRFYIGSHWGVEDDRYVCSSNAMRKAYRRRKHDFKRRILSKVYTDRKELLEVEQRWIDLIKPEEFGRRYYNVNSKVGQYAWWMNEDTKAEVVEKMKARQRLMFENMSDEEKTSWKESYKNRYKPTPDQTAKRVASYKKTLLEKTPLDRRKDVFNKKRDRPIYKIDDVKLKEENRQGTRDIWKQRTPEQKKEICRKISEGLKGRPSPVAGAFWWTNGINNKRSAIQPGPDWIRGRRKV